MWRLHSSMCNEIHAAGRGHPKNTGASTSCRATMLLAGHHTGCCLAMGNSRRGELMRGYRQSLFMKKKKRDSGTDTRSAVPSMTPMPAPEPYHHSLHEHIREATRRVMCEARTRFLSALWGACASGSGDGFCTHDGATTSGSVACPETVRGNGAPDSLTGISALSRRSRTDGPGGVFQEPGLVRLARWSARSLTLSHNEGKRKASGNLSA
jgi:hypothetical protein